MIHFKGLQCDDYSLFPFADSNIVMRNDATAVIPFVTKCNKKSLIFPIDTVFIVITSDVVKSIQISNYKPMMGSSSTIIGSHQLGMDICLSFLK